jgi:hypothetical protein
MSREERPPDEASSGPSERRREFLSARGMSDDSDELSGEPDEHGDDTDEGRSEASGGAVRDSDEAGPDEESTGS